jgi:hypothetical protein
MFGLLRNLYKWYKSRSEKIVKFALIGVDNAGKSTLLARLKGGMCSQIERWCCLCCVVCCVCVVCLCVVFVCCCLCLLDWCGYYLRCCLLLRKLRRCCCLCFVHVLCAVCWCCLFVLFV